MSLFINIASPLKRHFQSFIIDDGAGRTKFRFKDLFVQYGVPVVAGIATLFLPGRGVPVSDMLAGVALIAGALFGLVVLVFELQIGRGASGGAIPRNRRIQRLIDELFHNSLYAAIIASLTCASIIVVSLFDFGKPGFAVVAALGVHLGLAGLMCIKGISQAFVSLRREQDERAASRFADVS